MEKTTVSLLRGVAAAVLRWADSLDALEELPVAEEECAFLPEGIQRDFPHENLRRWGCYFFALLRWAQELGARANLADDDIISIFEQCRGQMIPGTQNPIVTATAFVNDPVRLLNFLAGTKIVSSVALWTNDPGAAVPALPVFVIRETHPQFGAHFLLSVNGKRWDSLPPLSGRVPAGFRVLA